MADRMLATAVVLAATWGLLPKSRSCHLISTLPGRREGFATSSSTRQSTRAGTFTARTTTPTMACSTYSIRWPRSPQAPVTVP